MIVVFVLLAIVAEVIGTVGGFGSSLFFVPLAGFFFDLKTVLGITALFHVFSNLAKLILFRGYINWRLWLLFGVPGVLFVLLGAWLSTVVSLQFGELLLAIFLILFSTLLLLYENWRISPTVLAGVSSGGVAGFLAGFIGTGGAVRGLALAAYNLEKNLFVATSAAIDMGVDVSRSVVYVSNGFVRKEYYYLIPILLGVSIAGSYIGKLLLKKIPQEMFRKVVLVLILLVGVVMLVRSTLPFLN